MTTSDRLASLKEEIASRYQKHCSSCTGSCCSKELEDEFIAFDWEAEDLRRLSGDSSPCSSDGTNHFLFEGGRCPFSGDRACSLSLDKRPLDCLTYPVYPKVYFDENDEKVLGGLYVREGCHRLKEISEDEALLEKVRLFWEYQITQMNNASIKQWMCEMAR